MRLTPQVTALLAGSLALTSAVRAGSGYLAAVGPAPVRFAEAATPVKRATLPPLLLADPKAREEITFTTNAPPTRTVVAGPTNETVIATTNIVVTVPISPVGADPLTLQNFVRYFQIAAGTNTTTVVPVPFTPPVPYGLPMQPPAQSRAIYEVTP